MIFQPEIFSAACAQCSPPSCKLPTLLPVEVGGCFRLVSCSLYRAEQGKGAARSVGKIFRTKDGTGSGGEEALFFAAWGYAQGFALLHGCVRVWCAQASPENPYRLPLSGFAFVAFFKMGLVIFQASIQAKSCVTYLFSCGYYTRTHPAEKAVSPFFYIPIREVNTHHQGKTKSLVAALFACFFGRRGFNQSLAFVRLRLRLGPG